MHAHGWPGGKVCADAQVFLFFSNQIAPPDKHGSGVDESTVLNPWLPFISGCHLFGSMRRLRIAVASSSDALARTADRSVRLQRR